jgi:GNAT superfamily N-acetyltransferase
MRDASDPLVRRAGAADVPALVDLRMAMDRELTGGWDPARETVHREHLARYLEAEVIAGALSVFVAEAPDGAFVATAAVRVVHRAPHPRSRRLGEGQVTGVYTIPAWRGRGLARRVVAACLDEARAWRVRRVWLRTSAAGRHVYEGMGFTDPGNYLQLDLD